MSAGFGEQPHFNDPYALAAYYEQQAIHEAGVQEVRDRLVIEQSKAMAAWNIAVKALDERGRPHLIESGSRLLEWSEFTQRSTGLLELAGMTDQSSGEVPVMRLSTVGEKQPKEAQDLEDWDKHVFDARIRAELFIARPMAPQDKNNPHVLRTRETPIPGVLSRLPKRALKAALPANLEVPVKPLGFDDGKGGKTLVVMLTKPHHSIAPPDLSTHEKVQAEVDRKLEMSSKQIALYSLIGAIGNPAKPLYTNPAFKKH